MIRNCTVIQITPEVVHQKVLVLQDMYCALTAVTKLVNHFANSGNQRDYPIVSLKFLKAPINLRIK